MGWRCECAQRDEEKTGEIYCIQPPLLLRYIYNRPHTRAGSGWRYLIKQRNTRKKIWCDVGRRWQLVTGTGMKTRRDWLSICIGERPTSSIVLHCSLSAQGCYRSVRLVRCSQGLLTLALCLLKTGRVTLLLTQTEWCSVSGDRWKQIQRNLNHRYELNLKSNNVTRERDNIVVTQKHKPKSSI